MKVAPIVLRFCSGSVIPIRRVEEQVRRVGEHERQLQTLEAALDLLPFVLPHDAVVDEDAGQAFADRAMNEQCGNGRIDAAAQPAHDPAIANLRADPLGRLLDERLHRPVAGAAADAVGEIAQDLESEIGVRDLRMEQQRIQAALSRRPLPRPARWRWSP